MLDVIIMGEMLVEIMREKEDTPLYEAHTFRGPFPSGAPAICIDAAARLGCKTAIIGGVGDDDFGKCLLDRLNRDGVDTRYVLKSSERSTGVAFVTYFADGSRKFIFHMGNTPAVEAKAPQEPPEAKYMHIMGCSLMANKEFAVEILRLMHTVTRREAKVSFDPNIRRELMTDDSIRWIIQDVMNHTSIFLPGMEELLTITDADSVEAAIRQCFTCPKMELVVLKNGSRGSTLYKRDGSRENIGVYKVVQVDATGAGDCYDGAFLAGLCQGKSPLEAAKMGAAAGALNAAAFGPMEGKINPGAIQSMIQENF